MLPGVTNSELERQIPALRRFARSLTRNPESADDLVQDVLVKALSRWGQLRNANSLRAWLFQILYNMFRAEFRRMRMVEAPMPSDTDRRHPVTAGHPDDGIGLRGALDALAGLPEDQRIVLQLVAIDGMSYEEVSRVVGIPLGTVMSRLSRGREKLRDLMETGTPRHLRRVK